MGFFSRKYLFVALLSHLCDPFSSSSGQSRPSPLEIVSREEEASHPLPAKEAVFGRHTTSRHHALPRSRERKGEERIDAEGGNTCDRGREGGKGFDKCSTRYKSSLNSDLSIMKHVFSWFLQIISPCGKTIGKTDSSPFL